MLPEPPKDEKPNIQGPGLFTVPIMRSRVIDGFRVTVTPYTQYANCSEMDLIADWLDTNPSTYLGLLDLQATMPGYRVGRNGGYTGQHAMLKRYSVSPQLPDVGFAGLTVNIYAFSLGKDLMRERVSGWTLVEIPKLQFTL